MPVGKGDTPPFHPVGRKTTGRAVMAARSACPQGVRCERREFAVRKRLVHCSRAGFGAQGFLVTARRLQRANFIEAVRV
jgi:hypothetical protein